MFGFAHFDKCESPTATAVAVVTVVTKMVTMVTRATVILTIAALLFAATRSRIVAPRTGIPGSNAPSPSRGVHVLVLGTDAVVGVVAVVDESTFPPLFISLCKKLAPAFAPLGVSSDVPIAEPPTVVFAGRHVCCSVRFAVQVRLEHVVDVLQATQQVVDVVKCGGRG
jgi:hypothetical protein